LGALEQLEQVFGTEVAFFVIYIKEAHPEDGWVLGSNRRAGVKIVDPVADAMRVDVARSCAQRLQLRLAVLVDGVDNAVASAYGGWPDRLYLVGLDGRIAFRGGVGPFGFRPSELESAIRAELGTSAA
jgi:iodothyronine deiodinase-like protein